MMNEMKSVATYDKLNRKHVVKVGETWMHGNYGIITITGIYRRDNKRWTTVIEYTTKRCEKHCAHATEVPYYMGNWAIVDNLLFKIQ